MKQALILVEEINRKKAAIDKSDSIYLKSDYLKSITDDLRELKDYCKFKKISFEKIGKLIK